MKRAATLAIVTAMAALSAPARAADTGFPEPFAGTPRYLQYAPTQATDESEVNQPLGVGRADRLARKLGLDRRKVFTPRQYRLFVTGKGVAGDPKSAKLVDASVRILTNTTGNPLYYPGTGGKPTPVVLGSYGVLVNTHGWLESPANLDAPTRQVNAVIQPGGYLGKWCRANGAQRSLRMLYRSAYASEVVYGNSAQKRSSPGSW